MAVGGPYHACACLALVFLVLDLPSLHVAWRVKPSQMFEDVDSSIGNRVVVKGTNLVFDMNTGSYGVHVDTGAPVDLKPQTLWTAEPTEDNSNQEPSSLVDNSNEELSSPEPASGNEEGSPSDTALTTSQTAEDGNLTLKLESLTPATEDTENSDNRSSPLPGSSDDEFFKSEHDVDDPHSYLGKQVIVEGTSRGDLNRKHGRVISFDSESGRYGVHMDSGREVALKPDKLLLAEANMTTSDAMSAVADSEVNDQLQPALNTSAPKHQVQKRKVQDPDGYLGKRVAIDGTNRGDLNRKQGVAVSFNTETGRYGVHVDNGRKVALKPNKLQLIKDNVPLLPKSRFPWLPVIFASASAAVVTAVLGWIRWQAHAPYQLPGF